MKSYVLYHVCGGLVKMGEAPIYIFSEKIRHCQNNKEGVTLLSFIYTKSHKCRSILYTPILLYTFYINNNNVLYNIISRLANITLARMYTYHNILSNGLGWSIHNLYTCRCVPFEFQSRKSPLHDL